MTRTPRRAHALALAALLGFATVQPAAAWPSLGRADRVERGLASRPQPGQWPQARSDLKADPDILFGALPNGMRYAIRRQATPPGQAALRLWIGAGSLSETDAQQGLAHFLEHMAFNGSAAVPEGDMVKILERLGLAFGADTNASTNFSETIYKLDLPRTDAETVDTSLMLLRETAGNLTIEQAAVERERGVVLSEERARDVPAYRIYKARLGFLLPGQRLPDRYPIGKVEVLKTASAEAIRTFYRRYYRPERAVLVAVGDFDPAQMEAKVRARFGDWKGVGEPGTDPVLGAVQPRKAEAKLVAEPGAPLTMQLAWVRPSEWGADTLARRRQNIATQLGFAVLNRRLSALARAQEAPFLGAGGFKGDQEHAADITMIVVNAEPQLWRPALAAIDLEARRAARHGVRQDELDREVAEIRALLRSGLAGAATRRPAEIAGEILDSLDDQQVVTSPAEDLAIFEAAVKDLKAAQVSDALARAFRGEGPLLFMASPEPPQGGEQALLAELSSSRKTAAAAPAAPRETSWPYEDFGTPGKIAETRDITDLDTVFVRFENGVRLTVKPTRFRDDEVLVRVNVGDGLLGLPRDRPSLNWAAASLLEGGLKQIDSEDMERVLASKVYGARFGVADNAFILSGETRPDDLDTQLQVLAAYVAEPGWRPEAFQRVKGAGKTLHDQYEATDGGVVARDLAGLLHGGDGRWAFPTREQMARTELADIQAQVAPALAEGPIEVVVVGAVSVETATDAVARTFGALPARRPAVPPPPGQLDVRFPPGAAQPMVLRHKGRKDQSIGLVAWPAGGYFANPQRARDTAVMGEVLGLRLIDELREAQGATYSPSVSYAHSTVWPAWGYISASVEIPPDKLPEFFADVRRIAADLRDRDVGADELARAKLPRLERLEKARVTNQYWLAELSGAQADPRRLDIIRQVLPGAERVSAADVRRAAQALLTDEAAYRLEVRPGQ